jgi:hypothetical protein
MERTSPVHAAGEAMASTIRFTPTSDSHSAFAWPMEVPRNLQARWESRHDVAIVGAVPRAEAVH